MLFGIEITFNQASYMNKKRYINNKLEIKLKRILQFKFIVKKLMSKLN